MKEQIRKILEDDGTTLTKRVVSDDEIEEIIEAVKDDSLGTSNSNRESST